MDFRTTNRETSAGEITVDSSWRGLERRSEARVAEDSPARVKVLDPMVSLGPSFQGRVVDTSCKGLKICAPRSILQGSVVQVRYRDRIVLAQVKYCLQAGDEFHVGVRFKEDW